MFYGQLMLQGYAQDPAISFCAFGDTSSDKAPLQVSDFGQGSQIDQMISKLFLEGGGGANLHESYELVAYFYLTYCELINVQLSYFFITGDEYYYNEILSFVIEEVTGLKPEIDSFKSHEIWQRLLKKFNVFHLHKPYPGSEDDKIKQQWVNTLGVQRVLDVSTPKACIDVMLGTIALTSGTRTLQGYIEDMRDRGQSEERIDEVKYALRNFKPEFMANDIINSNGNVVENLLEQNEGDWQNFEGEEEEKGGFDLGVVRKKVSAIWEKNRSHEVMVNIEKLKAFEEKFREKIPQDFYCPITQMLFVDPVVATDGNTYERQAIEIWLKNNSKSPLTNLKLESKNLTSNTILKKIMNDFIEKNS